MTTIGKVARLHLVDRFSYTWMVWGVLAFVFLINLIIYAVIPLTQPTGNFTFALSAIYIFMAIIGVQAATRFLPFAFTLGVSRRSYYLGTTTLVMTLTLAYSLLLTGLSELEELTNGWGLQLHFFRVRWVLDGPWYQVLLTNFVLLTLVSLFGLWCGLIYRRFAWIGTVVFFGVLTVILLAAALIATWLQWWPAIGTVLGELNVVTANGLLALLAAAVCLGGYATIRRLTI